MRIIISIKFHNQHHFCQKLTTKLLILHHNTENFLLVLLSPRRKPEDISRSPSSQKSHFDGCIYALHKSDKTNRASKHLNSLKWNHLSVFPLPFLWREHHRELSQVVQFFVYVIERFLTPLNFPTSPPSSTAAWIHSDKAKTPQPTSTTMMQKKNIEMWFSCDAGAGREEKSVSMEIS